MNGNLQNTQRRGSGNSIPHHLVSPSEKLESTIEASANTEWLKHNLLSLDGGGIRGYWSLLVIEKLMEYVAIEEEKEDSATYHSFYPNSWPINVSQIPPTNNKQRHNDEDESEEAKTRQLPPARRYLPCHYFDSLCGSSTGALIAIMLGRFRMTVPDCIYEYESLGHRVFGKPRVFTKMNFAVGNRYKYKAERLEKVFKEVTKRRNKKPDGETFGKITFPSEKGLCTTFVTTIKSQPGGASGTPYLIRSYDHTRRMTPHPSPVSRKYTGMSVGSAVNSQRVKRRGTGRSPKDRYEKAQEFEIWQVARAATAAPFYFEPLKIEMARASGHILFTDGGFSLNNNPTREGTREIEDFHGPNSIGIVVSVGTARKKKEATGSWLRRFFTGIKNELGDIAHAISDPEAIHEEMQKAEDEQGFPYYRLNHENGLDIQLDQWEPKRKLLRKDAGSKTITAIRNAFGQWASQTENTNQLQGCARQLVECRRKRMTTAKWERYATGARYRCPFQGCDVEDILDSNRFGEHLKRDHEIQIELLDQKVASCKEQWRYQDVSQP